VVNVWWSVCLTVGSLTCNVLIGRKQSVGWLLAVALQLLWAVYAVTSEQWGFIASALAFGVINTWNYVKWRRAERQVARERVEEVTRR
jgi:nicotinamide riboside transporter PnuC